MTAPIDETVKCGAVATECICIEISDHDTHRCECGGQWRGDIDGDDFEFVAFPGSAPAWWADR